MRNTTIAKYMLIALNIVKNILDFGFIPKVNDDIGEA